MLEGLAQLLEHGLDVALLHRGLALDEVGELFGGHEVVVVNGLGKVLAVGFAGGVLVLCFNEFLTHCFKKDFLVKHIIFYLSG